MRRVTLPDGLTLWALNRFEAFLVYREIVSESWYERHGITIAPGSCVFDVGANIGLFSIHLARRVPGVRIRSFELVPRTFAMLQRNLAEHAPQVAAVRAGLAASEGRLTLAIDRFSSVDTAVDPTVFARAAMKNATLREWATAGLTDLDRVEPSRPARQLRAALAAPLTRPFALAVALSGLAFLQARKRLFMRRESCRLRTLSAELAVSGFDRLDLVKIDVEGAEEDVLRGIDDADWPRIRQLVIEVHDLDGRRDRLAADLERRGYQVVHDREDWALHRLMGISTLFAIRR